MEEMGYEYDDELFVIKKVEPMKITSEYNVKKCPSLWFLNSEGDDDREKWRIFEYRADWFYSEEKYELALECYKSCLALIASSNIVMTRKIEENIVRCCVNIKDCETEPLPLAEKLWVTASNFDRKSQAAALFCYVYSKLVNFDEELLNIQRCLIMHPCSSFFWNKLSEMYGKLRKKCPNCSGVEINDISTSKDSETNGFGCIINYLTHDLNDKVDLTDRIRPLISRNDKDSCYMNFFSQLTCLLKSKFLLKVFKQHLNKKCMTDVESKIEKIDNMILTMNVPSKIIYLALSEMGYEVDGDDESYACKKDILFPDLRPEEIASLESNKIAEYFEKRWFNWFINR